MLFGQFIVIWVVHVYSTILLLLTPSREKRKFEFEIFQLITHNFLVGKLIHPCFKIWDIFNTQYWSYSYILWEETNFCYLICHFGQKSTLLRHKSVCLKMVSNIEGFKKYFMMNFKPKKSSRFHFDHQVNDVWITQILNVKTHAHEWPILLNLPILYVETFSM